VRVTVNDRMQRGYAYRLTEPAGANFHPHFRPQLTPSEMLKVGVFGGKYMTDCRAEFPAEWFERARLCAERHDPQLNFFKVNASQPLSVWRAKGWIHPRIRAAGSSGTAATTSAGAAPTTSARSAAGSTCAGT
jgi:hypothetical protein